MSWSVWSIFRDGEPEWPAECDILMFQGGQVATPAAWLLSVTPSSDGHQQSLESLDQARAC